MHIKYALIFFIRWQETKTKQTKEQKTMNRLNQWRANQAYKAKQNLLANIHKEIAPVLRAMRQADSLLGDCVMGRPTKEQSEKAPLCERGSLDKYNPDLTAHRMGTVPGSLAKENTPFAGLLVAGMGKAETETYQASK